MSSYSLPNRFSLDIIIIQNEIIHIGVIYIWDLNIITNNISNQNKTLCYILSLRLEEV
jgi:hypothetical protein